MDRKIIYVDASGEIREYSFFGFISRKGIIGRIEDMKSRGLVVIGVKRPRKCHRCNGEGYTWFNDKSFIEIMRHYTELRELYQDVRKEER